MRKFTLDIPDELNSQLELAAKTHRRSMGQQIIFLLETFFPQQADPSEVLNKQEEKTE